MSEADWTEEKVARLRVLWAEGHSTNVIGQRLGMTKNAVVGKAHRLDLPSRPSPIVRGGDGSPRPPQPRRVTGATLPVLRCLSGADIESQPSSAAPKPAPRASKPPAPPSAPTRDQVAHPGAGPEPAPAVPVGRVTPCCWVVGDPRGQWRYCDDPSEPGKQYCEPHCRVAFVKAPARQPVDPAAIYHSQRLRAAMRGAA